MTTARRFADVKDFGRATGTASIGQPAWLGNGSRRRRRGLPRVGPRPRRRRRLRQGAEGARERRHDAGARVRDGDLLDARHDGDRDDLPGRQGLCPGERAVDAQPGVLRGDGETAAAQPQQHGDDLQPRRRGEGWGSAYEGLHDEPAHGRQRDPRQALDRSGLGPSAEAGGRPGRREGQHRPPLDPIRVRERLRAQDRLPLARGLSRSPARAGPVRAGPSAGG
jgi:hypothetical protein